MPFWVSVLTTRNAAWAKRLRNLQSSLGDSVSPAVMQTDGYVPRDACIAIIVEVASTRAQILLDDYDPTIGIQGISAPLQVTNELLVGQVADAPLRPNQIIVDPLNRPPVLQPDVEDVPYAILALQRSSKSGDGSMTSTSSATLRSRPSVILPILFQRGQ
jgi:hypothetical protein